MPAMMDLPQTVNVATSLEGGYVCPRREVSTVSRPRIGIASAAKPHNGRVATVVLAEGEILERVLDATYTVWHHGLTRVNYGKYHAAQAHTAWGEDHQRIYALVDGVRILATAKQYDLTAAIGETRAKVCGLGAVFTDPAHRGRGCASELIERMLSAARREGASFSLLFSEIGPEFYARLGFEALPTPATIAIRVSESARYGAPMTMIRGGDPRDLDAIAAMGRTRDEAAAFHLERDVSFIHYGIMKKRLLAGLGRPGAQELHFFIAEEGLTAAAYVVVSVAAAVWTIEECGDRDPTGARVGAILQALIAREPHERRPTIAGWLPHGFVPPQVTVGAVTASSEVMMMRGLDPDTPVPRLSEQDVRYWRTDLF
jgi:GNAT superfamily N-acetyltransferase